MDWIIILYIAAALAGLGILILCVVLAVVIFGFYKNIKPIIDGVEGQVQGVTRELTDVLHKTNRLTEDVQVKLEKLNTVVDSVQGVGHSVQNLNSSVDRVTNSVAHNVSQNDEKISQVIQWSNVAMEIADKWQLRQKRNSAYNTRYSTTAETNPEKLPVAVEDEAK